MKCTTHHYACNCREERLREFLKNLCIKLKKKGMESRQTDIYFDLYEEITKFYEEEYNGYKKLMK